MPTPRDLMARLSGRFVTLEPIALEHSEGLWEAAKGDSELFRWMPIDLSVSPGTVDDWVQSSLRATAEGTDVVYTIFDAATHTVVGSTRFLEIRLEHLRAEIGWTWLARPIWGRGHNVECKLLLLTQAFENARLRRVEFKADARNERSRGALLALGTTFEGVLRKHMVVRRGEPRDSAYYSVIDDEWPALKPELETGVEKHLNGSASVRKVSGPSP
jgi:RimJ/RimL family protein N-acetyltransferase